MKAFILTLLIVLPNFLLARTLVFGAISTIEPHLMEKKLKPLMNKIEKTIGIKLVFQTGYDYTDTIEKFSDGTFDLGYIGPVPYLKAQALHPNALTIIAGIKNTSKKPFRSVIVTKKGSKITTLSDLKNAKFAFGSPHSTLSYYVPKYMLNQAGILNKIEKFHFLGRHDKVAEYVIIGKYTAGAIKQSVATKYANYLQVIATSQNMPGFMIVTNHKLDKKIQQQIKNILLNLENFEERKDENYNHLRTIIKEVESYK